MAPRSLKKFSIAVSGTIPSYKQADVKSLVESVGATFNTAVDADCTHLITTQKDVEKNSAKCKKAASLEKCHIVTIDWLVECSNTKKAVAEKSYLIGAASAVDEQKDQQTIADPVNETDKKRKIKEEDEDEQVETNKKQKDSQRASFKATLNVPVDEEFLMKSPFPQQIPSVYIEADGLIWDATLNQTDSGKNNNKFYRLQVIQSSPPTKYVCWTHWGRVGEFGQSAVIGPSTLEAAKKAFEKKFKDKSGLKWENRLDAAKPGKYTFIERDYEEDDTEAEEAEKKAKKEKKEEDSPIESALSKPLQTLMSFIFNFDHFQSAMAAMSYDAQKLPLGKLSQRTLKNGFSILKELANLLMDPTRANWQNEVQRLSNQYFTTIPHAFGRSRPPIMNTDQQIKKEIELLEALTDMDVANEIMKESNLGEMNALDRQFQSLGMKEMTRLEHKSIEFLELSTYLKNSRGTTHGLNYSVIDIFQIERQGEEDRFQSSRFAGIKNSDRRLLWHGSRSTNFGGILSQGLRIAPPEAPVNGYMFGKGVYLADMSTKSANYCNSWNSANMALLLLCDAELGDPMLELKNSDYMAGEKVLEQDKCATLGQGRNIPAGWKDAGILGSHMKGVRMPDTSLGQSQRDSAYLQYNEYIVYDVAQIRQRYLFYVHIHR